MSYIVAILSILGSLFVLLASVGFVRFSDVFCRMHASSKVSSIGIGLIMLATTLHFGDWYVGAKCFFVVVFIFLTTPVAAHILSRAAYLKGADIWEQTEVDELKDLYKKEIDYE